MSCLQCHSVTSVFKDNTSGNESSLTVNSLMNLACKFARQIQPLFPFLSLLVKRMCIGLVWRKKQEKEKETRERETCREGGGWEGNVDLEQYEELAAEVRRAVCTSVSVSITPVLHLPWKYIPSCCLITVVAEVSETKTSLNNPIFIFSSAFSKIHHLPPQSISSSLFTTNKLMPNQYTVQLCNLFPAYFRASSGIFIPIYMNQSGCFQSWFFPICWCSGGNLRSWLGFSLSHTRTKSVF